MTSYPSRKGKSVHKKVNGNHSSGPRQQQPTRPPRLQPKIYLEYTDKSVLFIDPTPVKGVVGIMYDGVTISRMVTGGKTKELDTIKVNVTACRVRQYYLDTICKELTENDAAARFSSIWDQLRKETLQLLSKETGRDFTQVA